MADVNMKTDSAGAQGQSANGAGASGGPQNAQSTPLEVSIKTVVTVNDAFTEVQYQCAK